jgi:hypothetical protein
VSFEVEVRIYCDEPGCVRGVKFTNENRGGLSKTRAGGLAIRAGWQTRGQVWNADPKVAYCPDHKKETK